MNPIQFRRHLHMHPELSFREHDTAAFISARLSELGIEHRPIAGTGVLAKIEGRGKADPKRRAVVLRADIDALPIDERNDADWSSRNQGVMHACGHDMHAAVLFGVLQQLATEPDFRGTIFGLFQPGEECNPGGASLVLAEIRSKATTSGPWSANTLSRSSKSGRSDSAPANTWPQATNCASRCTGRAATGPCVRSSRTRWRPPQSS